MNKIFHKRLNCIVLISAIVCIVVIICCFISPKDDFNDEFRVVSNRKEVMKEYICEQIGFQGIFTLTLYEDGTFSYYEGSASSYFGDGDWVFEDEKLTLLDKGTGKMRKVVFDYEKWK